MEIGGKSILECTLEDFIKAGFYTRKSLAKNGLPSVAGGGGQICMDHNHEWSLIFEDGIKFVYCTKCQKTHFWNEKDNPYVQASRNKLRREEPEYQWIRL